jgi:carbon monoxide dehydrogenase subunit G
LNELNDAVTVRTPAPVAAVWEELSTLDRLLGHLPGIASVVLGGDGTTGSFTFFLSRLGRVWKRVEASASLIEVAGPRLLRWRVETPSLEFEFDGTFELEPVGSHETAVTYRGTMRFSDRYAGPLDPLGADVLEEHLEVVAGRIAGRAARHVAAEQALGG